MTRRGRGRKHPVSGYGPTDAAVRAYLDQLPALTPRQWDVARRAAWGAALGRRI